jgi:hydantoinase/oxoprolinase-like protein
VVAMPVVVGDRVVAFSVCLAHQEDIGGKVPGSMPTDSTEIFHMWTGPSSQGDLQCFDQIACVHMSGLLVRSHMNAGQDGFRDESSIQKDGLVEGHWKIRNSSRRGSTDHTICFVLQVLTSTHHGCG